MYYITEDKHQSILYNSSFKKGKNKIIIYISARLEWKFGLKYFYDGKF